METRKMQDFDWAAWDKILEEAHTQEEYHKVIQALPDSKAGRGETTYYFIKKGIPPRVMLGICFSTSETILGMM